MQPYDVSDPVSIESYAKRLINHTFWQVLRVNGGADVAADYEDKKRKGGLGNLLEQWYFGYSINSLSEPDFPAAGVELKVTPMEYTKHGEPRAGERLVLSMIDYNGPISADLETSHLWHKCRLLLLIWYWRNRELESNLDYAIQYADLFTPPPADRAIIEADYRYIAGKIQAGRAEELSEADTMYLGACTKGRTAASSIVPQYYPPHTAARKRAWCYKNSYMSYVLQNYTQRGIRTYEPIVKHHSELAYQTFDELVLSLLQRYQGWTDKQLCGNFGRPYNDNKAQWVELSRYMLGLKDPGEDAEEFHKAGIKVKAIRIEEDGRMIESMSFPAFRWCELAQQEWEDSDLHNYFTQTRFLFMVFRRNGEHYTFQGGQFWAMPAADLDVVRDGWQKVVDVVREGIEFNIAANRAGKLVVHTNLPPKSANPIIHVRTHANQRYYRFLDGREIGPGSPTADANPLPDGTLMTNHCFWLNNSYILEQLQKIGLL